MGQSSQRVCNVFRSRCHVLIHGHVQKECPIGVSLKELSNISQHEFILKPWYSVWVQTFKWQEYINWRRKLNEAKASAAALKASISEISSDTKPPESKCRSFFRRSPLQDAEPIFRHNIYNKGILHNFWEVIFPLSTRRSFKHTKLKRS